MSRPPRPRDPLGRPLPTDSTVLPEPDPQPLPPTESLAAAQALIDAGRAFRAHEVLEAIWKADLGPEHELWRGLAQLAVGITHAQRGNARGAVALLRRAAATTAPWDGSRPHDLDVAALRAWALAAADTIAATGDLYDAGGAVGMPRLCDVRPRRNDPG